MRGKAFGIAALYEREGALRRGVAVVGRDEIAARGLHRIPGVEDIAAHGAFGFATPELGFGARRSRLFAAGGVLRTVEEVPAEHQRREPDVVVAIEAVRVALDAVAGPQRQIGQEGGRGDALLRAGDINETSGLRELLSALQRAGQERFAIEQGERS